MFYVFDDREELQACTVSPDKLATLSVINDLKSNLTLGGHRVQGVIEVPATVPSIPNAPNSPMEPGATPTPSARNAG